jgi:DtxR family Mn-dependent transcriptional regulator
MLQKLAALKPSLVKYEKHHGVLLTDAGKHRALEVLRHHRLLERFLHDVLDYPWDEVHEEAERLEHFISERLEDRIAAKLGDPETDPHGHSIPERNGSLKPRREVPLVSWACGVPAVISSVSDRDPAVLREVQRLGLLPGTSLVVELGRRGASVRIRVGGEARAVRLSGKLVDAISVAAASADLG